MADVFQTAVDTEVACVGQLQFLMRTANAERRVINLAGVETSGNANVIQKIAVKRAVQPQTAFTPSGWNNPGFHGVAEYPVEVRRFMALVQKPQWNKKQAGLHAGLVIEAIIQPCLLDFDLTLIILAGHGVLQLEFGLKRQLIVETMTEKHHKPEQIGLRVGGFG